MRSPSWSGASNIISTVEEIIKIQKEGAEKRRQGEVALANMEKELRERISAQLK